MAGAELATQSIGPAVTTGHEADRNVQRMLPWIARIEEHPSWGILSELQVTLRAGVVLNRFRVRDLLGLAEGQVFESISPDTDDVSLWIGQVQVGWSEFEVLDQKIALRLTRLG